MLGSSSSDPPPQQAGSWHGLPGPEPPGDHPATSPHSSAAFSASLEERQGTPGSSSGLPGRPWHTQPAQGQLRVPRACLSPQNPNHDDNTSWEGGGQGVTCFWTPHSAQGIPRGKALSRIPVRRTGFCCFYSSEVLSGLRGVKWI